MLSIVKISKGLTEVKFGLKKFIELGNLEAKRDWGYAKDYIECMWLMLQQKKAKDYVIGTGKSYSIIEFIKEVCKNLNIKIKWIGKKNKLRGVDLSNGKTIVKVNPNFYRPSEVNFLKADFSKAKKELKWKPKTSFTELVKIMIETEVDILKNKAL